MFEVQRTQSISIPEGEVAKIRDANGNVVWQKCEYMVTPITDAKAMPVAAISVSSGDTITIYYYLTTGSGYIYDASNCGGSSFQATSADVNVHRAKTFTVSKAGILIIAGRYSNYQWGIDWPGSVAISPPYGDYIKIKIN